MSDARDKDERPDARERPADPAGTRPRYAPEELLPAVREPLLSTPVAEDVEADVVGEGPSDLLPERVRPAASPAPPERVEAAFAPRFQFALGALIALAMACLAATAAIVIGDREPSGDGAVRVSWSEWHPVRSDKDAPTQIAEHVGREYRFPSGLQLVAVTGGPLEIADLPVTVVMKQSADQGGDIELIGGTGVLYRLCGLGPKCSIDRGKPSRERHLLLRREALELALYSFRYLKDVDHAVVFMPPRKGEDPKFALLFRKRDLEGALSQPLRATLTRKTPHVLSVTSSPDAPFVNQVTESVLFQFSLTQANQDARAFLVLEPLDE